MLFNLTAWRTPSPPYVLIAFRAACAPLIVLFAWRSTPPFYLAAVVYAALVSDVFDGVVARRLGISTPALRHADTIVDTVFYLAAAAALVIVVPHAFASVESLLMVFVTIHIARAIFEVTKFGRVALYHMWSAKTFGLLLAAAFGYTFMTSRVNVLLAVALSVGIWNELEGVLTSVVLPSWQCDVPSVVHAVRRARLSRLAP